MRERLLYWSMGVLLLLAPLSGPLAAPPAALGAQQPPALGAARAVADGPRPHFSFSSVVGQTTGTSTPTLTATATATATTTPVATGTPIGGTGIVPTTQNVPTSSGIAGVACASGVGQTCTATGSVSGTFTITSAMSTSTGPTSFTLVATGPANALAGGYPALFVPTTYTVEAFQCGAVTAALQTTCTGMAVGSPLQNATVTVRFPLVGGATSDVAGVVNLGATATTTSVPLSTALTPVTRSGQAGVPCATVVSATCTVSGSVTGSGTVTASITWSLTATIPSGVATGIVPTAVFTTTAGLEGITCNAIASGASSVTCTGTTVGNALQGSTVTVVFTTALTAVGTITGSGANLALVASALPPLLPTGPAGPGPIAAAPLLGGPFATGPLPPLAAGPPLAANVGVRPGPLAEVPIVPEADPVMLLVAGLAIVGLVAWWRGRRDEVERALAAEAPTPSSRAPHR
ncbi:MAG TPA: hypothetical protein VK066_29495 [Chloroflexota bacterium]|nr:hypothetical protein [Chloroflexota bacterium]